MTTLQDELRKVLEELGGHGISPSVIVSRDGLLMSVFSPTPERMEAFAAMSATMLGAAETASRELKKGQPERVIVESKGCRLIVQGAGSKAVIAGMVRQDSNLGMALLSMDRAAEKVKGLIR